MCVGGVVSNSVTQYVQVTLGMGVRVGGVVSNSITQYLKYNQVRLWVGWGQGDCV